MTVVITENMSYALSHDQQINFSTIMTKTSAFTLLLLWMSYKEAMVVTKPNMLSVINDLGLNNTSYKGSDIQSLTIDRFAKEGIHLQQYIMFNKYVPSI